MELKTPIIVYISAFVAFVLFAVYCFRRTPKKEYKSGKKAAGMSLITESRVYKAKMTTYKIGSFVIMIAILATMIINCVLIARPHTKQKIYEEQYSRDIMICMDLSTSVDYLNARLCDELVEMVDQLKNERIGIVIFNTSPVLLSPLTNDYDYIKEILNGIKIGLQARNSSSWNATEEELYWEAFISEGTLVGNEERGSSLVGDGLAAAIYDFNYEDKDRTKIIIYTTDNDVYGEEIVTMPEAAQICKEKGVIAYGVGTKEMYTQDMNEMRECMELTGGAFYLEEDSDSFARIVEDIDSKSASMIQGPMYIQETVHPKGAFIALLISMGAMLMIMKYLKR